jgi:pimeloyl-ACP methyl ester carboxylesterase
VAANLFETGCFHTSEVDLPFIEGPPNKISILLLHGIASRWQPFQSILTEIVEKYHVFAVDLRGHGQSSHTPGAYHLEDYTRDIHQFIVHQVREPAVIYGHSLGALIGINLAAQQPHWVRALILGDPPLYHHDTLTQDTFWQLAFIELLEFMNAHRDPTEMDIWLAQNMPGMSPDRRTERIRSLETLDPDVVRAVISNTQMEGVSLPALAPRVVCPVLLLRGNPSLGSALREQDVDFAIQHFPRISVLEMENAGHGIIPAPLLPQMMAFIDSLEGD